MTRERLREIAEKIEKAQALDEDINCLSENIEDLENFVKDDEIGRKGRIRISLFDEDRVDIGSTYVDGENETIKEFLIGFMNVIAREKAKKEMELQGIEI